MQGPAAGPRPVSCAAMRRLRTLTSVAGAAALLAVAGGVAQAPAQSGDTLTLEATDFQVLRQDEAGGDSEKAYVLRQGQRYQFRVHYRVAGAASIRTGHTFVFQEVATGRQVDVDSRSFDPDGPGVYNEYSARVLPRSWTPGVYRIKWTLRANAVTATSTKIEGSAVFLVAGPLGG